MTTGLGDPWFWELRAGAARTLAEEMKDETAKATMLRIAENYDSLAAHVSMLKAAHTKISEQPNAHLNPNVTALQKVC
jgi:hypothetical protein